VFLLSGWCSYSLAGDLTVWLVFLPTAGFDFTSFPLLCKYRLGNPKDRRHIKTLVQMET
jgi:hypothetical protein